MRSHKIRLAISIGTLQIGGAEVFVYNLLKKIDYDKFDVLLVVLSKRFNTFLEKDLQAFPIKVIYLNKGEGFNPFCMAKIYAILWKFKPDILHGNIGGLIYFLPFIATNKIRCIHTVHTLNEFEKQKKQIISRFYKKGKIIPVAISKQIESNIIENYEPRKIVFIPNGIDIEKFRTTRKFNFEKVTIGHVGRFEIVKNHETIVKVFKRLIGDDVDVNLYLVGNGTLYDKIFYELNGLKNVTIKKYSPTISEEMKKMDIFIFPSIVEGMPLSLIEALASGLVIVGSNIGGISEFIKEGENGFLIDGCYNTEMFVEKIKFLIENKQEIIRMSINNMEKAKQYEIKKMVDSYMDLYIKEAK